MRIAHIHPSVIAVPPNGWGAIEKIIWDYKIVLESLGHEVGVVPYHDFNPDEWDIVHAHLFDQALGLAQQGIPYFYSHHDHHSMVWGEESQNYLLNLEAMQKAEVAFVHAKSSIPTFKNVPYYLSHGVNTDFFKFTPKSQFETSEPRLLIVGNNGLAGHDKVFDRKGFRYAIEAARMMKLPITIVGPSGTQERFFEENPDLRYERLTYRYDATEEQLRDIYSEHDILVHATYVEAGHPPLTPLEAMACGLPVVGTYMGENVPQVVCKRETADVVLNLSYAINKLEDLSIKARNTALMHDWKIIVKNNLLPWYEKFANRNDMSNTARRIYHQATRKNVQDKFLIKYIDGAQIDVVGTSNREYHVEIIDPTTNEAFYGTSLKCGMYAKSARRYHRDWIWRITDSEGNQYEHKYDASGKRVYIAFESSSLGDTLAWVPFVEEFRKKHDCEVVCSTFHNELFIDEYPHIQFVDAGSIIHNIYAMYRLGWFYDNNGPEPHYGHHSRDFRKYSLQGTACDILGLEDVEIRPKIKNIPAYINASKINGLPITRKRKYVVIAPHATAWAKYWHHPEGWSKVIDFIRSKGYEVWNISMESASDDWHNSKLPEGAMKNSIDKTGFESLDVRISQIKGASLFIGLGSGLSWLAWACETPVVLISGFSRPVSEFTDCTRVFNQDVCNGCFNDVRLDPSDWKWCPKYANTDSQFECSKSITPEKVIEEIRKLLT